MSHNLLIKNVNVIDAEAGVTAKRDLFIADGRVSDGAYDGDVPVLDGEGMYAAPAFMDAHVHVFENKTTLGIHADKVGVEQGVLRVVDAGSVGISDFDVFKREIIEKNRTEVLYFLNISRKGLCENLSELSDLNDLMTGEELHQFIQKEKGQGGLVGLKVRMSSSVLGGNGVLPLIHARKLSDQTGLPLMIHIGNAPPDLGSVLDLLQKGDIVTHCFHGKKGGVPDYGREFQSAVKRGVHFDVGHGNSSFSFETVPKVRSIHDIDFSISTDIYIANYEAPVESLMVTMSKFTPFGFSVEELVRKVSTLPHAVLHLEENNLKPGQSGDVTLFTLDKTPRNLVDSEGVAIRPVVLLEPRASIQKGKVVWQKNV